MATKLQKIIANNWPQLAQREWKEDLSASSNMFGSIANSGMNWLGSWDFLPTDNTGGIMSLTGENLDRKAQWLGLGTRQMQYWAYCYCAPLAAVIDRIANADANGRVCFLTDDGKLIANPNKIPMMARIRKLMLKPNPMQTWDEFDSQQVAFCKTFGYCPMFAVGPVGMDKTYSIAFFNLNPFYAQPVINHDYSMFAVTGPNTNPIKEWTLTILGTSYTIPSSDILLLKDGHMDATDNSGVLPLSKVAGLDYFVSNICAAMEADNVLLKKKGPLGIFSSDAKPDMAGQTPMPPTEQKDLQEQLARYGLTRGQMQHVISKWPVRWNPMSFSVSELMTKETVRQGTDGICDRMDYPAELMSGKNATYENRNSAERFLYQNNIIPFSLRRMARYNIFFGLQDTDYNIRLNYDHLPVLMVREDLLNEGQANKENSIGFSTMWKDGVITQNQYLKKMGMDELGAEGDIYYPQWLEQNKIMQKQVKPTNNVKKSTPKNS